MVVKFVTKNGSRIHGPPYTKAEEADFYRRNADGPVRVELITVKRRSRKHRGGHHRKNNAVLEALFETIARSGRAETPLLIIVVCNGSPGWIRTSD